jgi:hypothetical protein
LQGNPDRKPTVHDAALRAAANVRRPSRNLRDKGVPWQRVDVEGVLIYACGAAPSLDALVDKLPRVLPPLAQVDEIVRTRTGSQ